MIGQSVGSDANPLSCFLFRPRKNREKRKKRSHTNVSSTLSTRSSTPPAQTPQHSFQGAAAGTHATPVPNRAHSGSQGETGVLWMGALSLPSEQSARSRTSPGRVSERRTLPLLGLGRVCFRRTQKAFGTAMRLCASLFRGVAAPLGCVICLQLGDVAVFFTLCAVLSERARWGWYHYPRSVPHVSETLCGQGVERQTLPLLGLGRGCSQRTQRARGTAMRLCVSLSRGVAAPLGCVIQ